ncbi:MAG: extracellular solute-binding protein [Patescibacteria group bacterium]
MQKKVLKLVLVVVGAILVWVLTFWLFGHTRVTSKATLEFWSVFDDKDNLQPLLDDFTNKTGIKVNYRNFTDLQDYRDTLLIELAAGEGPDVLAIHNTWVPKYKKFLQPLPKEVGYPLKNLDTDFVAAVPQTLLLEDTDGNDQLYGLPMYVDSLALFYNKAYFRNILSKAYSAPDLTWAGVRNDSIGLTQVSNSESTGFQLAGIALGRADNISRAVDIFYTLYHQLGGGDLTSGGSTSFYKPISDALEFMTSFSRNIKNKEYSWSKMVTANLPNQEVSAFAQGRVAMILGFSYYYNEIKNLLSSTGGTITVDDIGVSPVPQLEDPLKGGKKIAVADFFALSAAKSSKYPNEAWRLILDLTSKDSEEKYFAATKRPTSRRDLIDSEKMDPAVGVFAEQAVYADTLKLADDAAFDAAIASVLNRISNNEISVADGSSELASLFQTTIGKSQE